jgi:hypothetical protein
LAPLAWGSGPMRLIKVMRNYYYSNVTCQPFLLLRIERGGKRIS